MMPHIKQRLQKSNVGPSTITPAMLQKIVSFSLDIICTIDDNKQFTFLSDAAAKIWGYQPQELIGKKYIDYVVPADRDRTLKADADVRNGKVITNFRNKYICKNGKEITMIWSAKWDPLDQVMYCIARDGSEAELAERIAREKEDLNNGQYIARIGNYIIDKVFMKPVFVSDCIYEIFGFKKAKKPLFDTSRFFSLLHPGDRKRAEEELRAAEEKNLSSHEFRAIRKDGKPIWICVTYATVKDNSGRVTYLHGTIQDITEQKMRHDTLLNEKEEYRRMLTAAFINAQEQERLKIGRELHDHLSQVLTTVKHYCEFIMHEEQLDMRLLKKMVAQIGYCVEEIRKVARELSPHEFGDNGLPAQLREVARQVLGKKLPISFRTYGINGKVFPKDIQTAINRITQEQLNHIASCGDCGAIKIYLSASSTYLVLRIKDDCTGADIENIRQRPQFINMLTRTEALKGTLQLHGQKGQGCNLRVKVPLG